jgi:hypothetical protein
LSEEQKLQEFENTVLIKIPESKRNSKVKNSEYDCYTMRTFVIYRGHLEILGQRNPVSYYWLGMWLELCKQEFHTEMYWKISTWNTEAEI